MSTNPPTSSASLVPSPRTPGRARSAISRPGAPGATPQPPDDPVSAVIEAFSRDRGAGAIFVVDADDHLLGCIPEQALDADLVTLVLPQRLWPAVREMDTRDVLRAARAPKLKARDLMVGVRSVTPKTTLTDAVGQMVRPANPWRRCWTSTSVCWAISDCSKSWRIFFDHPKPGPRQLRVATQPPAPTQRHSQQWRSDQRGGDDDDDGGSKHRLRNCSRLQGERGHDQRNLTARDHPDANDQALIVRQSAHPRPQAASDDLRQDCHNGGGHDKAERRPQRIQVRVHTRFHQENRHKETVREHLRAVGDLGIGVVAIDQ